MKNIISFSLVLILIICSLASCLARATVTDAPTVAPSDPLFEFNSEEGTGECSDGESLTEMPSESADETVAPTVSPTLSQTATPTDILTEVPTEKETLLPTEAETETAVSSEEPTESQSEEPTEDDNPSLLATEGVTEAATAAPTEQPTEQPTESEPTVAPTEPTVETEAASEPTLAPTQPTAETTMGTSASTEEPTDADTQPTEEETLPIGTLNEELARAGITGYDTDKLNLISLYYQFYYIGGALPNHRQTAASIASLFEEYFADLDKTDSESMTTAVILCYQQALGDRYATYFDEEAYKEQQSDQGAEFVGIGVYVSYSLYDNSVQVLSVFKGTPAAEAGILPGDYIVSVDGVTIEEIGYNELVNRIRGEVDSHVTVGVVRDGEALSFTMQRKAVESVSVTYRQLAQDQSIGYVKIEQFDSKTAAQFKAAIDDLLSCGIEALIFDLRGNPGGEVGAIVDVLDYLLPDGKVIARFRYDEDLSSIETVYTADDGHEVTLPMTVLCDGYTASAGELFTSALRDHEAATVIGVTTYGKGTAQILIDLDDGTAFTISVARYDPPSGENYEGVGITPHIVVELSEEAAAVNAFLRDDAIDNQLQTAVAELDRLRDASLQ